MNKELIKRVLSSIVLIPIVLFCIVKGSIIFNLFIIICFLITSYEWYMMSKNKSYHLFGFLFLIISFYVAYKLRNFGIDYHYFISIMLICISTDIGGYVFGKTFKGPKIIKISPNKTYSGLIGSYIFSMVFLSIYFSSFFIYSKSIIMTLDTFIFIFFVSTISQLGDIIISYFKRLSKIKDTGKIIPGHGGLLDRVDGMIFAFPFSYMILKINLIQYF